jgi:hypothetical protein
MIVNFKFFHEKTNADFEGYNKLWDENKERFIFLQTHLSLSQQMSIINDMMGVDNVRDILALRFPSKNEIQRNKIINDVLLGNGVVYKKNKIWYPKEVWVYSPQQ